VFRVQIELLNYSKLLSNRKKSKEMARKRRRMREKKLLNLLLKGNQKVMYSPLMSL
jgi:hypothetical protein